MSLQQTGHASHEASTRFRRNLARAIDTNCREWQRRLACGEITPEVYRKLVDRCVENITDHHLRTALTFMASPSQLNYIAGLALLAGVDADEECLEVTGLRTSDLSKKEASSFIDHLKSLQ